jgi:hypothetical protein
MEDVVVTQFKIAIVCWRLPVTEQNHEEISLMMTIYHGINIRRC